MNLPTNKNHWSVPHLCNVQHTCIENQRATELPKLTKCDSNTKATHTHTHPFNGPMSGSTRVSQYQKGKTDLDFTGARDSEWQWHQLGDMQVCISLQTDNHASTSLLKFFTGRMPFLPPNQQCQSTEGNSKMYFLKITTICFKAKE